MIRLRLTAGDIRVTLTTDAHYSPDVLDDLTTASTRTITNTITELTTRTPGFLTGD